MLTILSFLHWKKSDYLNADAQMGNLFSFVPTVHQRCFTLSIENERINPVSIMKVIVSVPILF